jgi:peptidoglycan/xylan/chitin deacetylase (PgdA/CDA1 family)
MRIEFSFDDGHKLDLNVTELLAKYNFTGTFYIPSSCELTEDEICFLNKVHTIGGHTVSHPQDMKLLDDAQLYRQIQENKDWLEKVIGEDITKFCYPRGRYDERVKKAVKDAGYEMARTTKIQCFSEPEDPYETHTAVHVFQRPELKEADWLLYAKAEFHRQLERPDSVYHVWGHSWEIDRDDNWDRFEELLKLMSLNHLRK